MLVTEQLTRANKDWEELDVVQRTRKRWKTTYFAAAKNAMIKKKSAKGKYHFGSMHSAMQDPAPMHTGGSPEGNA